ncbi:Glu-tRNA(Gln) amidotransferase subunit GatD [Candidatus Woesearchaeota archaeon]|nr:Glu-tRNA(Gln) amidotransferase subunit GatD [Candidatus Woesearchaeota archaeon]
MNAKPGDRVIVTTKKEEVDGILMPNQETEALVLKLASGYNIGISQDKVVDVRVAEAAGRDAVKADKPGQEEQKKANTTETEEAKKLPAIAILHTGGTIASKVDYATGGVIASFTADDFLAMFPEIKSIARIKAVLIDNLMSEDMRFSHYQKIARAVQQEAAAGVDGIIIGHGTDTLAVTAAALSFMIESPAIPIILVGAQRSSDRPSTDAALNLLSAALFIAKTDAVGVAICMHETVDDDACVILPPAKTRKMHTTRRDAFKAVGDTPLARIDYEKKEVTMLKQGYLRKEDAKTDAAAAKAAGGKKMAIRDKFEEKVGILRVYPNMSREVIDVYIRHGYKGLVLEGTGLGHAPTNIPENHPNYEALKEFIAKGGLVVLTSQCIFGRVNRDVYTNTRRLGNIGVIYGEDMLTETAFVKLAWLLGNYGKEEARKLLAKNLRGEISERTEL